MVPTAESIPLSAVGLWVFIKTHSVFRRNAILYDGAWPKMIVEIDVSFNHAVSIFRIVLEILIVQSLHLESSFDALSWQFPALEKFCLTPINRQVSLKLLDV